jgi:hypothetical protein
MRKTKNLSQKIKNQTKLHVSNNVRDLIKKAVSYVSGNKAEAKKAIISALVELVVDKDKATTKEQNEFSDRLRLEISNMGKRLSGKDSRVRFAPKMICIAMSRWLWDGKGYQEFQESNFCLLLSPKYL